VGADADEDIRFTDDEEAALLVALLRWREREGGPGPVAWTDGVATRAGAENEKRNLWLLAP
jgi:hypothetical protein